MMDTPVMHIMLDEDGIPRTINRFVKVKMIVQRHLYAQETLQEIADFYEISLADVHAAMAYYYDNQATLDAQFKHAEALRAQSGVDGAAFRAEVEARLKKIKGE